MVGYQMATWTRFKDCYSVILSSVKSDMTPDHDFMNRCWILRACDVLS